MTQYVTEAGNRKNFTATGTIVTKNPVAESDLLGVFVSQASASPTLKIADTEGTIANTFTPVAGTFYPLPCKWRGTLTVTIANTVDCTVFWKE